MVDIKTSAEQYSHLGLGQFGWYYVCADGGTVIEMDEFGPLGEN